MDVQFLRLDVNDHTTHDAARSFIEDKFGKLDILVNNAAVALDMNQKPSEVDIQTIRKTFDTNFFGVISVTQALLPQLNQATIVIISSTAGLVVYEGGGGYTAAKHAQTALAETLRLELSGRPIRVVEIDPGMVRTEEFGLVRFGGDETKAYAAYEGVAEPLVADDIADLVAFAATRPHHVNLDRIVVRPLAQAAQHKVHRVFD